MKPTPILAACALTLCALFFPAVAGAQISELPANQQLIDSYALTMENIRKVDVVSKMYEASNLPEPKNEDSEVEEPLAKQWTAIEQADTAGILRKAGISARDYLMTLTVIVQTMIDVTLSEKPRSEINKANVELYKKNRADIERIMQ